MYFANKEPQTCAVLSAITSPTRRVNKIRRRMAGSAPRFVPQTRIATFRVSGIAFFVEFELPRWKNP